MFKNKQVRNGLVDALLLAAFLAEFYMSLTGLGLHQWLGILIGVGAGYHLLTHRKWVEAVVERFFKALAGQARWYAILDAALLVGFTLIIETGVIMSTWLNLALPNYAAWSAFHTGASITTLVLLVTKLVLHWRWIVKTIGQAFGVPAAATAARAAMPAPANSSTVHLNPAATRARPAAANPQPALLQRRQFLTVAGITSLAALLSIKQVFANSVSETTSVVDASAATTTAAAASTTGAATCQLRCNRRCSYPGRCGRYTDSNGNGRCDLGECI
jgi:hypothetical protein